MDQEKFRELCNSYFLDDITSSELDELNSALNSGDAELLEIFRTTKILFEHLPLTSEMSFPSAAVKERIMRQISSENSYQKPEEENQFTKLISIFGFNNPKFAFGFSIILILGLFLLGYNLLSLKDTVESQKTEIVQLKTELEKKQELLAVLESKQIEIVIMNGLKVNPAGYGKVIWSPDNRSAILQISNLPAVPKDKDYELWVIKDDVPINSGVFSFEDKNQPNFFKITNLAEGDKSKINAFAITLEPKGGVPKPTGDMYLLGSPNS